jgi:hypothetical protein
MRLADCDCERLHLRESFSFEHVLELARVNKVYKGRAHGAPIKMDGPRVPKLCVRLSILILNSTLQTRVITSISSPQSTRFTKHDAFLHRFSYDSRPLDRGIILAGPDRPEEPDHCNDTSTPSQTGSSSGSTGDALRQCAYQGASHHLDLRELEAIDTEEDHLLIVYSTLPLQNVIDVSNS